MTSGSRGVRCRRDAGKDFAIELRVRLPSLRRNDAAISDRLPAGKCSARLLHLEANVFIASKALTLCDPGCYEYLNPVANREYPFRLSFEFANQLEQALVIAEVLGSTAAQNENSFEVVHAHLVKGDVGLKTVPRTFDKGVPSRLEVMHNEVEATR